MNHLTVLARPPLAGLVKPRLSPALPAALAARLHEATLADAVEAAAASGADARTIAWSEAPEAPAAPRGFATELQGAGDPGERLAGAFVRALRGEAARAVVLGSECPGLSSREIDAAFAALEAHDAVLGVTAAGGFWLVGLSRPAPEWFRGVPWGADRSGAAALERARVLGLRVARLETLADLDTPADLAALVGACASGRENVCGPRTREALREMGLLP